MDAGVGKDPAALTQNAEESAGSEMERGGARATNSSELNGKILGIGRIQGSEYQLLCAWTDLRKKKKNWGWD